MESKPFHFITYDEDELDSEGSSGSSRPQDYFVEEEALPEKGRVPSLPQPKLLRDCRGLERKRPKSPEEREASLVFGGKLQVLQSASTYQTMTSLTSQCRKATAARKLVGGFRHLSDSRAAGLSAKDFDGGSFKRIGDSQLHGSSQCTIALKLTQHRGDPAIEHPTSCETRGPADGYRLGRNSVAAGYQPQAQSVNEMQGSDCRHGTSLERCPALKDHQVLQASLKGKEVAALSSSPGEEQKAHSRHSPSKPPCRTTGYLDD